MGDMRRGILSAVLGLVMVAASGSAALASPPHAGCGVGPNDAGPSAINGWQLWDEPTLAGEIEASFGNGAASAAMIFASEDRNGDGMLCVMKQVLPNDASGATTWFVSADNTANAKR